MKKVETRNALEILKHQRSKDSELQRLYEEEQLKYRIGIAIRTLREQENLTQAQLAKKIGTSQSAIARLESTDYEGFSLKTLEKIAEVFHQRLDIRFVPAA